MDKRFFTDLPCERFFSAEETPPAVSAAPSATARLRLCLPTLVLACAVLSFGLALGLRQPEGVGGGELSAAVEVIGEALAEEREDGVEAY